MYTLQLTENTVKKIYLPWFFCSPLWQSHHMFNLYWHFSFKTHVFAWS